MPKLLLADDSLTIQRVIELTFAGQDVQVIAVSDGDQAIARIPIERPDIILADISMRGRSGYDVAAFIKARPELAHIPVLLLAGAFEPVDQARADAVNSSGVIVKPFEPQQVVARVRELLTAAVTVAPRAAAAPALPAQGVGQPRPDKAVDEYFERLDAAFATRGGDTPQAPQTPTRFDGFAAEGNVPTLETVLGDARPIDVPLDAALTGTQPWHVAAPPVEPPEMPGTLSPATTPVGDLVAHEETSRAGATNSLADAFTALLELEQGEPGPAAMPLAPLRSSAGQQATAPAEPVVTEALIEEVTRRVLERLSAPALERAMAGIVSDVAERLLREEMTRLRRH